MGHGHRDASPERSVGVQEDDDESEWDSDGEVEEHEELTLVRTAAGGYQSAVIDHALIDAMHMTWPQMWRAATNTSREKYETLVRCGARLKVCLGKTVKGSPSTEDVVEMIENDVRRSGEWFRSPLAEQTAAWALPRLGGYQLSLLRKILQAFAARADEHIRAGSLRIHAHYVQGWNYLARMLLFSSNFDAWSSFRVFEGLMLEYGMAHFSDTEAADQLWTRVFARYDSWYGFTLGPFGHCVDAQHFFRGMSGTALQMSAFTVGSPPLTALKALTAAVHEGKVGAPVKMEEMLTGAVARTVRLSGVRPFDLDMTNGSAAYRAMSTARANLGAAAVSRGLHITAQLRIALRFQQRKWCQKICDAFILKLTLERACRFVAIRYH